MIDGNDDDVAAPREISAVIIGRRSRTGGEASPVTPEHYGAFRATVASKAHGGRPDVEHQAIFTLDWQVLAEIVSAPAGGGGAAGSRWGALCPYPRTSRTSLQSAGSTGGMKRFEPVELAPYGIPLKILIPLLSTPRILPKEVSAMTNFTSCALNSCRKTPPEMARAEMCFRKSRRVCAEGQEIGSMMVSLRAILPPKSTYSRQKRTG